MTSTLDPNRRKLVFRAWRRGFREMDLLMGTFADEHMAALDEDGVAEFCLLYTSPSPRDRG